MKLNQYVLLQAGAQQLTRALSPPRGRLATIQDEPTPMKPLRVAVVTEGRAGPEIMRWAARNLLQPADEVHLLHVLAKSDRNAGGAVPPLASGAAPVGGPAGELQSGMLWVVVVVVGGVLVGVGGRVRGVEGGWYMAELMGGRHGWVICG